MILSKKQPMISTLDKDYAATNRIIYHVKGEYVGPTIVFFAGIHGNESAGVKALNNVLPQLKSQNVHGEIFGVYGNIMALKENKRYIDKDLNRIWTTNNIKKLKTTKRFVVFNFLILFVVQILFRSLSI